MLKLADLAMREDFSLGPLWVSPALRLVKGPAGELHVEPLTMQVFLLLADAKGQVVTRNRLYDECWGGVNVGDYSLNRTITMVRRIAAEAAPGAFRIESIPRTGYRLLVDVLQDAAPVSAATKRPRPALLATVAIAVSLAGGCAWLLLNRAPTEPSVAIDAGSGTGSVELAQGIANSAMNTAAEYQTTLRLLDGARGSERADFVLRVRKTPAPNGKIDLSLVSDGGKSLLWSWTDQSGPSRDQAARAIGGAVLACAAETRAGGNPLADQETVKLYLDACSKFDPWAGADIRLLVDAFKKVTVRAPQLRGAWFKLFASEAEAIEGLPPVDLREGLKQDIRRAEAYHVDIPELNAAKAVLLPPNARFERLQLYEKGLAQYPNNLGLLAARSWILRSLGRMDEAARTGQRLATLYPQSPAANTEYANSLMHSGRAEAARNVLDRAAKIAPDAANLQASRWVLEMRYGDPKVALAMARSGDSVVEEPMISFLEARINPTKANVDRAIDQLMAGYRHYPIEPGWVAQALVCLAETKRRSNSSLQSPTLTNRATAPRCCSGRHCAKSAAILASS